MNVYEVVKSTYSAVIIVQHNNSGISEWKSVSSSGLPRLRRICSIIYPHKLNIDGMVI